jgi:hypothetical protein
MSAEAAAREYLEMSRIIRARCVATIADRHCRPGPGMPIRRRAFDTRRISAARPRRRNVSLTPDHLDLESGGGFATQAMTFGGTPMTLAAIATAGLITGLVFNAYALLAFCLVIISVGLLALLLGLTQAGLSILLGSIIFQLGYGAGLCLASLISGSAPPSVRGARLED